MKWLNVYRMKLVLVGVVAAIMLSGENAKADFIWTQKADMPTPRWKFATCVVDGKIYAIGGRSSEPGDVALSTVEEYDPVTDTWTRKADMLRARSDLSTSAVSGRIYAIGGNGDGASVVEEYDPATGTWTRKADMPTPRRWLATCALNRKIYAIGGTPRGVYEGLSTVEVYDPVTDTWTNKADMPFGVWGLCTSVVDGRIYVFGGRRGLSAFSIVQVFDPATDTWTRKSDMLIDTSNMASAVLGDKIFVIGGWFHSNSTPYKTVQEYDTLTDEWTEVASLPVNRSCLTACVLNNKIYAIGGTDRMHPCPATSTVYELTKSGPPPDFNGDGIVDSADMCIMVDNWHTENTLCDIAPPPCGDGIVDVQDLIVLAEHLFEDVNDPTLIAYWPLDEAHGDIAYDNAGICDGRLFGPPIWQPAGGMVDGALQFDGVDDFIFTGSIPNSIKGPFSVLAWVKGGAPGQVVISQTNGANWLYTDTLEGNLMTELNTSDRDGTELLSQTIITDGDWHRLGLVGDGSYRMLYVDGLAVAEDTQDYLEVSEIRLFIGTGKDRKPGSFWSGLIDDVRIYNRAMIP